MDSEEKFKQSVDTYMNSLADAITKQDFFEYAKALGVLEYLGMSDIEYYNAFAFQINEEFDKAAELFLKVPQQSVMYPEALHSLAIDYSRLGLYMELNSILSDDSFICSSLEELTYRIQCLQHASYSYLHEHSEELSTTSSTDILRQDYIEHDGRLFFDICRAFTVGLVVAGECINQCSLYQHRTGIELDSISGIKELEKFAEEYERQCKILQLSKYLKIFRLPDNFNSLADCVLHDKSWKQKIVIFRSTNYVRQILQIIYTLCNPEIHKNVPMNEPFEQILEAFLHIQPQAMAQVVDHYFEIVSKVYAEGKSNLAQYLGYIYSEILATEKDPYNLKERIDSLRKLDSFDFEANVTSIKLARSMSRKGHDAYVNALESFRETRNIVQGPKDYSALSLQFFRVLEIEYCEKLIVPLADMVDLEQLQSLASKSEEDWKIKAWGYDINCLKKIKTRSQDSFEIGAIRTFLGHIIGWKTQNDPCAEYLRPMVEDLLTDDGKRALKNKEILNVINEAVLEKYRVPGAHTGFLPYSTACESKEYVSANLEKVVTWYK